MQINHLQYFLTVARLEHISKASLELGLAE